MLISSTALIFIRIHPDDIDRSSEFHIVPQILMEIRFRLQHCTNNLQSVLKIVEYALESAGYCDGEHWQLRMPEVEVPAFRTSKRPPGPGRGQSRPHYFEYFGSS